MSSLLVSENTPKTLGNIQASPNVPKAENFAEDKKSGKPLATSDWSDFVQFT